MTLLSSTLLALSLAAQTPAAPAAPNRITVDRVAAVVNGEVVTLQELVGLAGEELRHAQETTDPAQREKAVAQALRRAFDGVVSEKLLSAQATALGVEVTDAQVDEYIDQVKKQNNFDDAQLDQALAAEGKTRADYRAKTRRELETFNVLRFKVRSRVKLTDEDLRNYYQAHHADFMGEAQVHVRHIFLPLPETATPKEEARVRAEGEKVLQRLATGEEFAQVAREVSKGPGAEEGGDLGWLARGTIQKKLEDVAFSLKKGEVSGLIRVGPGLHILKAEDVRTAGARPFEDVKPQIEERMQAEQIESYRQQYLAELRKDAVIEVRIPELKD